MFAQRFYAGTVCNIIQIVFPAIHGLDKVLVDLRDERKGSLPVGCVCIVLMLRQLPCLRKAAEQTLDVLLLFLRDRKMGIVILEELHAFTGGEVAVRWASRAASLPPFMYGEININLAMRHPAAAVGHPGHPRT